MRRRVGEGDTVGKILDFGDADERFHVAMARAARFSTGARYIDTWRDFLRLYRVHRGRFAIGPEDREAILAEHDG
jgi:DNA-binding GntR family transcriptional regulator